MMVRISHHHRNRFPSTEILHGVDVRARSHESRIKGNKPRNTLRCGSIKATIWQNVSEKGAFFATTFSRPFKDQSGTWRNGTSFGLNDLEALVTVARDAKEWMAAHVLKR